MRIELPAFEDQREQANFLVKNKRELIDMKKSAVKQWVTTPVLFVPKKELLIVKDFNGNEDTEDTVHRTIIGNTYNWMDSHDDAHKNNLFAQSIKDRGGRIWHRHDHVNQLTAKVGKFSNVYEQVLNWTDVGVNRVGQTMSLLADSAIRKSYNNTIFEMYRDGEIDQHSVGMQYDKLLLAVNNAENKEEFETWNKYIGTLGNPEKAIERGFFWLIVQAKLIEISCVTEGSNELTGIYNPPIGSMNIDPPSSSQKSIYSLLLN